jgi:hypothetical protein
VLVLHALKGTTRPQTQRIGETKILAGAWKVSLFSSRGSRSKSYVGSNPYLTQGGHMSYFLISVKNASGLIDKEDSEVPGFYVFEGEVEEEALDRFHDTIPISCLEDFDIEIITEINIDPPSHNFVMNCKVDLDFKDGTSVEKAEGNCQDIW